MVMYSQFALSVLPPFLSTKGRLLALIQVVVPLGCACTITNVGLMKVRDEGTIMLLEALDRPLWHMYSGHSLRCSALAVVGVHRRCEWHMLPCPLCGVCTNSTDAHHENVQG